MTRRRRQFSPEFKEEASRVVLEGDRTVASVARAFDVNVGTLGSWVNRPRPPRNAGRVAYAQDVLGVEWTRPSPESTGGSSAARIATLDPHRRHGPYGRKGRRPSFTVSPRVGGDDGATAVGYFPYRPYCSVCDRDLTTVTAYDDDTTELSYTCVCGHAETVPLSEHTYGKLVWKVDWPMRWAYEGVVFEPSGVDHNSPGSSFVVGGRIVAEIFKGEQPIGPMYAFVGISGMAKMSGSKGGVPTPVARRPDRSRVRRAEGPGGAPRRGQAHP